jgi:hypothetical protein
VDRLSAEGWPCTTDPAILDGWGGHNRSLDAVQALRTVLREVRFLPLTRRVVIDRFGGLSVVARPAPPEPDPGSHDGAIGRCLSLWLGRVLTLATAPDLDLRLELTGGIDSRAVLAPVLHLRERGLLPGFDEFGIISPPRAERDFAVAQNMAQTFGLVLNRGRAGTGIAQGDAARHAAWRLFSLGMYASPAHTGQAVAVHGSTLPRPHGDDFTWHRGNRMRLHHSFRSQYELRTPPLMGRHLDICHRYPSDGV